MRHMATIQKILDIQPIPDADAIEVATINGWKVVVKKNEFKIGELVIYSEVDSFIPTTIAPFLTRPDQYPKVYDGVEGERLKTIKLRGQLSQGLILPISLVNNSDTSSYELAEGTDVSENLGIVKYEPPVSAQLAGISLGAWPSQVPKTDEERLQNLTREWELYVGYTWEVSEKLEGSSMSVILIDDFKVCSRNLNLRETPGNTLWELARHYDIETKLRSAFGNHVAIQGEVIGEGIQGNHYGIKGHDFYVFQMYNIATGEYFDPEVRQEFCASVGLKHVPILDKNFKFDLNTTVKEALLAADGPSVLNVSKLREGKVYKRVGGQEHFKTVSDRYLLASKL